MMAGAPRNIGEPVVILIETPLAEQSHVKLLARTFLLGSSR
jgi:hypothetical protein